MKLNTTILVGLLAALLLVSVAIAETPTQTQKSTLPDVLAQAIAGKQVAVGKGACTSGCEAARQEQFRNCTGGEEPRPAVECAAEANEVAKSCRQSCAERDH
jgi:hypothetical protein